MKYFFHRQLHARNILIVISHWPTQSNASHTRTLMNMALDSDSQEAALSDIRALNAARIGTRPGDAGSM